VRSAAVVSAGALPTVTEPGVVRAEVVQVAPLRNTERVVCSAAGAASALEMTIQADRPDREEQFHVGSHGPYRAP
jgi:hypothetical protein